jgi:meiotic recombination protein SPO11
LVVEKDATFQKLLDERFLHHLPPSIILTAKGYPDLNTRQFLHRLWRELAIPVLALVDADPFGVEILLTYRFGSLATVWCCERTAVPELRWIAVHPSDFEGLSHEHVKPLSREDDRKLSSLLQRPYMEHCPDIARQLNIMHECNAKAEIQSYQSPTRLVLDKIAAGEWI